MKKKIGFAVTGSFCTFQRILKEIDRIKDRYDIFPILSHNAANTDTRFFNAEEFKTELKTVTGHEIITTIADAEPIGPRKLFELLVVAPCTGNTVAKLSNGITDTSVTLAAKAHLRNARPLVIGISTNDGLANNAKNIGALLDRKNIYFVPFGQDDYNGKPNSVVADFSKLEETIEAALEGKQVQPVIF
ncbi:MAG: dipicolinate synthase subunit B [Clostridiales bacterium]|jgi:dipicolinate synthase subunit B|nr:dipicolinate synthase subunit B [Clostridiales bacterium]